MELTNGESYDEQSQAYALFLNHALGFTGSMSLNCAIELGIADLIDSHGGPMPLSELAASVPIPPEKAPFLPRLMRLLANQGIFAAVQGEGDKTSEIAYLLTPLSRFLLTKGTDMSAFFRFHFHPFFLKPLLHLSAWFKTEGSTPAEEAYDGKRMWDLAAEPPEMNKLFNEAPACHSRGVVKAMLTECSQVFQGLKSLLDVGGGTGTAARMIAEAFPQVKCTVFDLPHAVATIPESSMVDAIGGDMFEYIPPANATLLKVMVGSFIYSGSTGKNKTKTSEESNVESECPMQYKQSTQSSALQTKSHPFYPGRMAWFKNNGHDMRNAHRDIDLKLMLVIYT